MILLLNHDLKEILHVDYNLTQQNHYNNAGLHPAQQVNNSAKQTTRSGTHHEKKEIILTGNYFADMHHQLNCRAHKEKQAHRRIFA